MPVEVHLEPEVYQRMEAENCVDCRQPTRYWFDPHTPLCPDCAHKRPGIPTCGRCRNEIDPKVCWCGDLIDSHGMGSGHAAVPFGCTCGFPGEEWKQRSFDILIRHISKTIPPEAAIKQLSGVPLVEALQGYVFVPRDQWEMAHKLLTIYGTQK